MTSFLLWETYHVLRGEFEHRLTLPERVIPDVTGNTLCLSGLSHSEFALPLPETVGGDTL